MLNCLNVYTPVISSIRSSTHRFFESVKALTRLVILSKIQDGGQDAVHVW